MAKSSKIYSGVARTNNHPKLILRMIVIQQKKRKIKDYQIKIRDHNFID